MDPATVGIYMVVLMFFLIGVGLYLGIVLLTIAITGFVVTIGLSGTYEFFSRAPLSVVTNYTLTCVPMFLLMGQLLAESGYSKGFYEAAIEWTGRIRGGLAIASVAACAVFASACGSSVATAAAVGSVAVPEMRRYGYSPALSTGAVAAGGTIGNMIPPSLSLVLFGLISETSIAKLLMAGLLPGICLAIVYSLTAYVWVLIKPGDAPGVYKGSWAGRLSSIGKLLPAFVLFVVVMGSIYAGVATPTESSALGAVVAAIMGVATGRLNLAKIRKALGTTVRINCVVGLLFLGSMMFSRYLSYCGTAEEISVQVVSICSTPILFVLVIVPLFLVLGCFLEGTAIVLLIVPLLLPTATMLGVNLVWFGVFVNLLIEIGLITPPVGLNVFVIGSVVPDVKLGIIFKGCLPFVLIAMIMAFVFFMFPQIVLVLPDMI